MCDPDSSEGVVCVRKVDDYIERDIGCAFILRRIEADEFYVIDGTGYWVFRDIQDGANLATLVQRLNARFPAVTDETVARDVVEFVTKLSALGLVALDGHTQ